MPGVITDERGVLSYFEVIIYGFKFFFAHFSHINLKSIQRYVIKFLQTVPKDHGNHKT